MAKILIVDDDPGIVEALSLVLEAKGHEVLSANNRVDRMKAAEESDPELLILDVMMDQPDDGIVTAQDLRRGKFTKPIIMLTSLSKVAGMSFGKDDDLVPVDEYLDKPVDPNTLIAKVDELLKKQEG